MKPEDMMRPFKEIEGVYYDESRYFKDCNDPIGN